MAETTRRIYLYEEFNASSAKNIVESLLAFDKEDRDLLEKMKEPEILPIYLHIASYGIGPHRDSLYERG